MTGANAVAAGSDSTLALLTNGTLMAWGNNKRGQLGNGTTKSSTVPVTVTGIGSPIAISVGGQFALATT